MIEHIERISEPIHATMPESVISNHLRGLNPNSVIEIQIHSSVKDIVTVNPLHVLHKEQKEQKEHKQCLICLETESSVSMLTFPCRCSGVFHKACVNTWHRQSRRCPICRNSIAPPRNIPSIIITISNRETVWVSLNNYVRICIGIIALLVAIGIPAGILYLIATDK